MRKLLIAVQFLTSFPIKIAGRLKDKDIAESLIYFPVVGVFIGTLLAAANVILSSILPQIIVNILLVGLWVVITGGLHLDGLADTFDALGSGKSKKDMLGIMRDVKIGTFGIIAIVIVLLIKVFGLYNLDNPKTMALIFASTAGRFSVIWPLLLFKYPRKQGKARPFFRHIDLKITLMATIITLIIAHVLLGMNGVMFLAAITVFILVFSTFLNKKFGGITGDNLGAIIELTEAAALILFIL